MGKEKKTLEEEVDEDWILFNEAIRRWNKKEEEERKL